MKRQERFFLQASNNPGVDYCIEFSTDPGPGFAWTDTDLNQKRSASAAILPWRFYVFLVTLIPQVSHPLLPQHRDAVAVALIAENEFNHFLVFKHV